MNSLKFQQVKMMILESKIDFTEVSNENIEEILNTIEEWIPGNIYILILEAVKEIKEKL